MTGPNSGVGDAGGDGGAAASSNPFVKKAQLDPLETKKRSVKSNAKSLAWFAELIEKSVNSKVPINELEEYMGQMKEVLSRLNTESDRLLELAVNRASESPESGAVASSNPFLKKAEIPGNDIVLKIRNLYDNRQHHRKFINDAICFFYETTPDKANQLITLSLANADARRGKARETIIRALYDCFQNKEEDIYDTEKEDVFAAKTNPFIKKAETSSALDFFDSFQNLYSSISDLVNSAEDFQGKSEAIFTGNFDHKWAIDFLPKMLNKTKLYKQKLDGTFNEFVSIVTNQILSLEPGMGIESKTNPFVKEANPSSYCPYDDQDDKEEFKTKTEDTVRTPMCPKKKGKDKGKNKKDESLVHSKGNKLYMCPSTGEVFHGEGNNFGTKQPEWKSKNK